MPSFGKRTAIEKTGVLYTGRPPPVDNLTEALVPARNKYDTTLSCSHPKVYGYWFRNSEILILSPPNSTTCHKNIKNTGIPSKPKIILENGTASLTNCTQIWTIFLIRYNPNPQHFTF